MHFYTEAKFEFCFDFSVYLLTLRDCTGFHYNIFIHKIFLCYYVLVLLIITYFKLAMSLMNIQSPERVEKLSISTECEVSLRIQSECGKIRTRKKLPIWTLFTQWRIQKKRIDYSQNILYLNIISIRNWRHWTTENHILLHIKLTCTWPSDATDISLGGQIKYMGKPFQ